MEGDLLELLYSWGAIELEMSSWVCAGESSGLQALYEDACGAIVMLRLVLHLTSNV